MTDSRVTLGDPAYPAHSPMKLHCEWIFCSSAIGVQGGFWWQTSCGHRASGVKQLPDRCDYCGKGVIDNARNQQSAQTVSGSPHE